MEDTEHYLLNCNLFQNLREELLNTVTTYCQPTLNVLLNGDANLSESEKKYISAVQEFILKTKRFQPNNSNNYNLFSNTYLICDHFS